MKKLYKVTCEFYVKAESLHEVEIYLYLLEEAEEFVEQHLIVSETNEKIADCDIYKVL